MAKQASLNLGNANIPEVIAFARHETFHPRFGWLKKGFDRAAEQSDIFLVEDAPVRLGVGKNMVRSIRYWCNAFKLLEHDQPTDFGIELLDPVGWDSYLEDPASLWLLHWQLLQPPCYATAWEFAFNHFHRTEFTVEDLFYELCDYRDRISPRTADSSIKKDVSCLLRMYTKQPTKAAVSEDSLDCPFAQLGLIHTAGDARHYTFRIGPKRNLPAEIVVYACLCHADRVSSTARSIPLASLLYDTGGPGMLFKLTESALSEAIEQVARRFKPINLSDAAGKLQLSFAKAPLPLAQALLNSYYDPTR
jgi:hypothetical protein